MFQNNFFKALYYGNFDVNHDGSGYFPHRGLEHPLKSILSGFLTQKNYKRVPLLLLRKFGPQNLFVSNQKV